MCEVLLMWLQVWRRVSKYVLQPGHPLELHKQLFDAAYAGWEAGGQQGTTAPAAAIITVPVAPSPEVMTLELPLPDGGAP